MSRTAYRVVEFAGVGSASLAAAVVVATDAVPLGVPGSWVWNRMPGWPSFDRFLLPAIALVGYLAFAVAGLILLRRFGEWLALMLVPGLIAAAAVLQYGWLDLPKPGLGMERWALSLYHPASSGYFTQAKQVGDLGTFLAEYDQWISRQDSFHIGTHPPGLIVVARLLLDGFQSRPEAAQRVVAAIPARLREGFAMVEQRTPMTVAEKAALAVMALATWGFGLATVVPVYVLARQTAPPAGAWVAATLWPLVPASPLFLPVSDCLFPLLSITIVVLLVGSVEARLGFFAVLAGALWAVGMFFSLAFLALTPLVVGYPTMRLRTADRIRLRRWLGTLLFFLAGAGLLLEIAWHRYHLNLLAVWSINLEKHAGFYEAMPRAYWPWVAVNLIEFAVVVGPTAAWLALAGVGSAWRRRALAPPDEVPRGLLLGICWLATLMALDFSGRNLSEVARLWIFLTPFAPVLAAQQERSDPPSWQRLVFWGFAQWVVGTVLVARVEPLLPIAVTET